MSAPTHHRQHDAAQTPEAERLMQNTVQNQSQDNRAAVLQNPVAVAIGVAKGEHDLMTTRQKEFKKLAADAKNTQNLLHPKKIAKSS